MQWLGTAAFQINCHSITLQLSLLSTIYVYKFDFLFLLALQTKIYIWISLWCAFFSFFFFIVVVVVAAAIYRRFILFEMMKNKLVWKITKTSQCDVISNITDLVISIDANCRNIITINIHFIEYYFKACIKQRNNNNKKTKKKPADLTRFSMCWKSSFWLEHYKFFEWALSKCVCVCVLSTASDGKFI